MTNHIFFFYFEKKNQSISFNDSELVATRCYVESPFNNENAIYFGGFDPNGFLSTNKAWIYKKINTLNEFHRISINYIGV